MSAPARFQKLLKRLFGRRTRPDSEPAEIAAGEPQPAQTTEPVPMFSLGDSKQELVASYRNLESESA